MNPNPTRLATQLRELATLLDTHGDQALRRAHDWAGNLRGTPTDSQPRATGHSDPTPGVALNPHPDPTRMLEANMAAAFELTAQGAHDLARAIRLTLPQRIDRQTALDLDGTNTRTGYCAICANVTPEPHWHTGTTGDRLRKLRTCERRDSEPFTPLACNPCRMSWDRRPDAHHGQDRQDYDEWHAARLQHLGTHPTSDPCHTSPEST